MTQTSGCILRDGRCHSYDRGHLVHFIQLRLAGREPWGWRDGTVEAVSAEGHVTVGYLVGGRTRLWHHAELTHEVVAGDPVRVHEAKSLLALPQGGVVCVAVLDGEGPVPEPDHPELWAAESEVGIVDVSTDRGHLIRRGCGQS